MSFTVPRPARGGARDNSIGVGAFSPRVSLPHPPGNPWRGNVAKFSSGNSERSSGGLVMAKVAINGLGRIGRATR